MISLVTVLCLLATSAFGGVAPQFRSQWEGRVVGGDEADKDQFPYIVSLRSLWNEHFCGGTIVSRRFVVTAAHCFRPNHSIDEVLVIVGAHHIYNDGTEVFLDEIIRHPHYNAEGLSENDIAVLLTESDIPNFARRQIPLTNRETLEGEEVVLAGWGHIWARPGEPTRDPEYLQFLHKTVFSHSECQQRMGRPIPPSTLCTISPMDQGACMGDSGGPLINNDGELVGVVSWGIPCARGYPDFYGNVFELRSWVIEVMEEYAP